MTPVRPVAVRVFFLLVTPALLAAVLFLSVSERRGHGEPELPWDDDLRREVQAVVEQRFVDPLDEARARELFEAALRAYVAELDPFSRYFTEAERQHLDEETTGTFGGIGVQIVDPGSAPAPGGLDVTAVRRGGPAALAGVRPGDRILSAGGEPVSGRPFPASVELLRGAPGTEVELEIVSPGGAPRTVVVERASVESDTVPGVRLLEGELPVGYLRIAQFTESTTEEVADALRALLARGARALVLDLRRDYGGVVRAAVDVASWLLPEGELVCVTRTRGETYPYRTESDADLPPIDLPLVVLVDETTASASEILAGALQDHGRAVLVGDRTYGKFLVQTIVPLRHGGVVRITTARYETPRGRSAQRDESGREGGLVPDVRVPLSAEATAAVHAALGRQVGPKWDVLPGRREEQVEDPQLEAALALLRGAPAPSEPVR